ncbi:MAG: septation protein A [Rhizomicrobium sp.]
MSVQLRRLALDLGPLVAFFIVFQFFGIYVATATFMVLVLASLAAGYAMERRLSPIAIFTAVIVLVFGGLTLYLKNDLFVKIKPTVIYTTFCAVLLGGLAFNRLFIKYALSFEFELPESAWRTLTWRWGLFFAVQAVLNEIVWRNFSLSHWVTYKSWLVIPMTVIFAALQTPLLLKHMPQDTSD